MYHEIRVKTTLEIWDTRDGIENALHCFVSLPEATDLDVRFFSPCYRH